MFHPKAFRPSRRAVISGAGAATLSLLAGSQTKAQSAITGNGMAGGGSILVGESPINFSIYVASLVMEEGADPTISGSLLWLDPDQRSTIQSLEIDTLQPRADDETITVITGFARLGGTGQHPIQIEVKDGGPPGSGFDEISVSVGDDGEMEIGDSPVYSAGGPLTAGDVQAFNLTSPDAAEGSG